MTRRGPLLAVFVWCACALATEAPAPADAVALEEIRSQIVALEIEKALAALDVFLGRADLSDTARADALDLRAQAHAASDDLESVEKDYRAILELRPDYAPKPELTSKRAMERFARVEAATLGTIHLEIDPADAAVFLDGKPVVPTPTGAFKALAGERRLKAERKGFDPAEVLVHAAAGQDTLLKVALVPNARSIVVRTDIAGVSVTLDGTPVGSTATSDGAPQGERAATLLVEDVPIGEHTVRLEKTCYAPETVVAMVRVDMANRSPDPLRVVTMRPARARVTVSGASYSGELRVDGEVVGSLPLAEFATCPGHRPVEVVASGRVVWSGILELEEADTTVDLSPRPNCVLVGSEWPRSWSEAASVWSLRGRLDPPGGDLGSPSGWVSLRVPPGTDLALGIVPRAGVAGEDRVFLYSPVLGVVEERPVPPSSGRPVWTVGFAGASFVDTAAGVMVAFVAAGGPASRGGLVPGDIVLSAGGRKLTRAAELRSEIESASAGTTLAIEAAAASGGKRTIALVLASRARILDVVHDGDSRVVRAAWGAADAAAGGADAPAALANLAILLEQAGRADAAIGAWRKARALAGAQVSLAARADYALGAAASSDGTPADAASLLERARSEAEEAGDALVAAAAADRLADLGVPQR